MVETEQAIDHWRLDEICQQVVRVETALSSIREHLLVLCKSNPVLWAGHTTRSSQNAATSSNIPCTNGNHSSLCTDYHKSHYPTFGFRSIDDDQQFAVQATHTVAAVSSQTHGRSSLVKLPSLEQVADAPEIFDEIVIRALGANEKRVRFQKKEGDDARSRSRLSLLAGNVVGSMGVMKHNSININKADNINTDFSFSHGLPEKVIDARYEMMWFEICEKVYYPVIHPQAKLRFVWILASLVFTLFEAFSIPFYGAFEIQPEGAAMVIVSIVNCYFLIDIVVTFFTGYTDKGGTLILDPHRIAKTYLCTWFIPDVVAAIPWDWIPSDGLDDGFTRSLRFVRAMRLLHLLRLVRMMNMRGFAERASMIIEANQFSMFVASFLRILFLLFGVTHWAACIWYMVGNSAPADEEDTWIKTYLAGYSSNSEKYVYSVYFTLTTMTTVGYGDMTPQNLGEVLFVLVLLLCASIVFAGLMGVLSDLIATSNSDSHAAAERKTSLTRWMLWRALPLELTSQIREHLYFLWETNGSFLQYEDIVKQQLSPALKSELSYHIFGRIIYSTPCFAWLKDYSVCVKSLSEKVESKFLERGDYMFRKGDPNTTIFILIDGSVWLSQNEDQMTKADGDTIQAAIEKGASTWMIPRNKQVGIVDMGKGVLGKTLEALQARKAEETKKEDAVINVLKMLLRYTPKYGKQHETELQKKDILDHGLLRAAASKLSRRDRILEDGVIRLQRAFRERLRRRNKNSPKVYRSLHNQAHQMESANVNAPAYLGDSCLWQPFEDWDRLKPEVCMYSAQCSNRTEIVKVERRKVKAVVTEFAPWLPERLSLFQEFVLEGLDIMRKDAEDKRRGLEARSTVKKYDSLLSTARPHPEVDWSPADKIFTSPDEKALTTARRLALARGMQYRDLS